MSYQDKIHIGTSGWNYKHWVENFYPPNLKSDQWLKYYCHKLSTVEINNSFYQLPDSKALLSWNRTVPSDFVFSIKASRYITHMKKLKDPEDSLDKFMNAARKISSKLGPILFQLPPRWKCNPDRLKEFLKKLSKKYSYTFEFRDQSWWSDEIYRMLKDYNAAFCIYELAGTESPREITADFVYIRLHGPGDAYEGKYDNRNLAAWAGAISAWAKVGKDVYCYFDNDQNGYAARNAMKLQEMLIGKKQ